MKIQDILFIVMFIGLVCFKKQQWFLYGGLLSLVLAVPLFASWKLFTAERLTWYAGAFVLSSLLYRHFSGKDSV